MHHRSAIAGIQMQQHLGIAARAEPDPVAFEFGAQFGEIVDFAVIGYGEPAVGARHRLRGPARQIEDRQAPVPQRAAAVGAPPGAAAVGPASTHRLACPQQLAVSRRGSRRVICENAVYPAHRTRLSDASDQAWTDGAPRRLSCNMPYRSVGHNSRNRRPCRISAPGVH